MKFVADQLQLSKALQIVNRVISPQNTMPVLSGLLIQATTDTVTLSATDLISRVETHIPADVIEPGELVLPASTLTDLIQRIPSAEVRVEADVAKSQAVVFYGKSRTTLHGYSSQEMPAFPVMADTSDVLEMPPGSLARVARQTLFATAKDESRPILKGIHAVLGEGKLVLVSTDGTRLSQSWVPLPDLRVGVANFVISGRGLQEAARVSAQDPVKVTVAANQIRFDTGPTTISVLLLEGRYPDYQRVLPPEYVTEIHLSTAAFRGAVERVNLIAHRDRSASIRLKHADGVLEVSSQAADVGQAYEVLDVESHGQAMDLSFNPGLLLDALKSLDSDEMLLEFSGPQMPARIRETENSHYFHIVLPLRQLV